MKNKIIVLLIILAAAIMAGIFKGATGLSVSELLLPGNRQILELRFLRVLMAVVAGSGLACAGIVLQAILRNSLAEPYLLGTSSGAGLGAVIAIIMGVSWLYLPLASFIGALLSIVLVYNLARENNKIAEQSLILSGVIVSVAFSAVIIFIISIFGSQTLRGMTWWLWGSLQVYDFKLLVIISIVVFLGIGVIYIFAQDLNAISIGEEEAIHLGVDIELIKRTLLLLAALITASLVCLCGIIGFVGLMIPHMMRMVFGPNHKTLIPVSCLAGAIFMVVCDLFSRTLMPPLEIPIGVITAIIGAPIFIFLLKQKQKI